MLNRCIFFPISSLDAPNSPLLRLPSSNLWRNSMANEEIEGSRLQKSMLVMGLCARDQLTLCMRLIDTLQVLTSRLGELDTCSPDIGWKTLKLLLAFSHFSP
ncbi:hypothetical protein ACS0TY_027233 [Phlomoides rotata]